MTIHPHITSDPVDLRLESLANRLRIDSIEATTAAKSGHPTSCCSAAEIMSVLFFDVMRYDPADPARRGSDRFVLSKGHAAPILYAAWAEAGLFPREELKRLRTADSDLEGHPTPLLPFVDVATGSLGQGLSAGAGMALDAKLLDRNAARIYVLLGDGECSEGSVWEAADFAAHHELDNLCAVVDVNRLGQSGPTELGYDLEAHARRWSAFGWSVSIGDGHDVTFLRGAFERAEQTRGAPSVILARTVKGKGIAGLEGKEGHHGKALSESEARQALERLRIMVRTNGAAPPHRWVSPGSDEDGSMAAMADVEPPIPNYARGIGSGHS